MPVLCAATDRRRTRADSGPGHRGGLCLSNAPSGTVWHSVCPMYVLQRECRPRADDGPRPQRCSTTARDSATTAPVTQLMMYALALSRRTLARVLVRVMEQPGKDGVSLGMRRSHGLHRCRHARAWPWKHCRLKKLHMSYRLTGTTRLVHLLGVAVNAFWVPRQTAPPRRRAPRRCARLWRALLRPGAHWQYQRR